jgi:hypothetical protein
MHESYTSELITTLVIFITKANLQVDGDLNGIWFHLVPWLIVDDMNDDVLDALVVFCFIYLLPVKKKHCT